MTRAYFKAVTAPDFVSKTVLKSLCLLVFTAAALSAKAQTSCERLTVLSLPDAKVVASELVPAKDFTAGKTTVSIPAHCKVQGLITPTSDSVIHFELWLPLASAWNGKYMQIGSGGWGGIIIDPQFIRPVGRGYAVAATDDGHNALEDKTGKFTSGHPQKLVDFGYRAVHLTASDARIILDAFYGKREQHAYFFGCSDGGREALMEAERYPEDFDGIIAGAPANHWSHLFTAFVWNERAVFATGKSVLPPEKLPLLEKAALAACDKLDGLEDGLIEDPRACHFDPAVLLCKQTDNATCLTGPQVEAVKKIYAGPKDPVTGERIYPGFEPGTEAESGAWQPWILGHVQADFGNSNFADATYENPKWDWQSSDLHQDLLLTEQKVAPSVDSYNPDLRSFRDHGGKLISYHGWGDAAIAPRDSVDFYLKVQQFLADYPDPRNTGPSDIQNFYRLFMVPGMGHCSGGAGAVSFGNELLSPAGVPQDADHDVAVALDHWVVDGVAPVSIIATRTPEMPSSNATPRPMSRPLCPFPAIAQYNGTGSPDDAASFSCSAAKIH